MTINRAIPYNAKPAGTQITNLDHSGIWIDIIPNIPIAIMAEDINDFANDLKGNFQTIKERENKTISSANNP